MTVMRPWQAGGSFIGQVPRGGTVVVVWSGGVGGRRVDDALGKPPTNGQQRPPLKNPEPLNPFRSCQASSDHRQHRESDFGPSLHKPSFIIQGSSIANDINVPPAGDGTGGAESLTVSPGLVGNTGTALVGLDRSGRVSPRPVSCQPRGSSCRPTSPYAHASFVEAF